MTSITTQTNSGVFGDHCIPSYRDSNLLVFGLIFYLFISCIIIVCNHFYIFLYCQFHLCTLQHLLFAYILFLFNQWAARRDWRLQMFTVRGQNYCHHQLFSVVLKGLSSLILQGQHPSQDAGWNMKKWLLCSSIYCSYEMQQYFTLIDTAAARVGTVQDTNSVYRWKEREAKKKQQKNKLNLSKCNYISVTVLCIGTFYNPLSCIVLFFCKNTHKFPFLEQERSTKGNGRRCRIWRSSIQ